MSNKDIKMEDKKQTKEYSMETDPLFKPISEHKKKVIDRAVEKQIKSLSLDENVTKDTMTIPGQNYALISIVSPEGNQKNDNCCIKIKGVFNTLEEANKHATTLQQIESTFDVYVVEMYSWLLVPPDPNLIEQKHVDLKLNEIISGHRESQLKSKTYFEERKKELIENINVENELKKEENRKLLKDQNDIVDISDDKEQVPEGINASSSINLTSNMPDGVNCPNSGPDTTSPTELMESMINSIPIEKPSKSWADTVEE